MRISDVLRGKPNQEVVTISPDAPVRELIALLARHNVGALVVSGDGARVDGIVSERDVVRRLHADESVVSAPVETIMTRDVRTCDHDHSIGELMQVMTDHRIRHVPVVAGDQLIGIVSIGDIVKNRMAELEFERDQLDSYIQS
ncbi:MAG: CBS domain-containing protein [Nocardioides sp.]